MLTEYVCVLYTPQNEHRLYPHTVETGFITQCVYCAVRIESLNLVRVKFPLQRTLDQIESPYGELEIAQTMDQDLDNEIKYI